MKPYLDSMVASGVNTWITKQCAALVLRWFFDVSINISSGNLKAARRFDRKKGDIQINVNGILEKEWSEHISAGKSDKSGQKIIAFL